MDRTWGTLLDGRIRYAQPHHGYRTGIEPVFLSAAVPARPGDRVLEAGCGAGAGLLCLLWRVPDVQGTGIEIDPDMAALARENVRANGHAAQVVTGDVLRTVVQEPFEHGFANPPWHDPKGTQPPHTRRALATHGANLDEWIMALTTVVTGSVTLAVPVTQAGKAMELLATTGFGRRAVLLLRPRSGREGKIALIQAWPGSTGMCQLHELVLHGDDGRFTPAADAVLRNGAPLPIRLWGQ